MMGDQRRSPRCSSASTSASVIGRRRKVSHACRTSPAPQAAITHAGQKVAGARQRPHADEECVNDDERHVVAMTRVPNDSVVAATPRRHRTATLECEHDDQRHQSRSNHGVHERRDDVESEHHETGPDAQGCRAIV